jgi:3-deoxy-D-manno-octulosonic-acid transferase
VADTLGELGLIYRLADTVLIGGSFSDIQGHNPWEAAALGCAIMHGPQTANFAYDYAELDHNGGAIRAETPADIVAALTTANIASMTQSAAMLIGKAKTDLGTLAAQLNDLRGTK